MMITEAAIKYRTDGATIWAWITSGRVIPSTGMRLVALPNKEKIGDRWVVREVSGGDSAPQTPNEGGAST